MKLFVFAVYDDKAKAFLPPWFMPLKGMAVRTFGDCVNDPKHQFGAHPEDYNLFTLGSFNSETGQIDAHLPEVVCTGLEVVRKE
ncbi:DNA binding protein vP5 [Microviridae sp.]|nr:DNA binding protein vP5 [Microviridae sp.]UOF81750.1 DNA binding protein vP5 [Microviridae sp.]